MGLKIETTSFVARGEPFKKLMDLFSEMEPTGEIFLRKFTAGDTGLSSRVLSHWEKHKLLPDGAKDTKGWRRFSLAEMVWLKIAMRLREFGFPLKKIAKIKRQIMLYSRENRTYPFLNLYIGEAWTLADDPNIVVLADGTADIARPIELELAKKDLSPRQKDMLLISVKSVLEELGIDVPSAKMLMPLSPREALAVMSFTKDNKEIKVTMNKGVIKEIESTSIMPEHPDMRKIHEDIKQDGEYAEVVTKYQKGVRQSAEVKKKVRF